MDDDIKIESAFAGGNIIVERQEGEDFWVHQDLRDTSGDWFYWCFGVRGAAGRTLTFHFTKSTAIGVRGPAVSTDKGRTWRWLGDIGGKRDRFQFAFPGREQEIRFSFGMPYQHEHWRAFAGKCLSSPRFVETELCRSRKGRSIPAARFGCLETPPEKRIVIACRHHCCEMMANYALEGLIEFVLSDGGREAELLRTRAEFLVVPFVDADGVEAGDQGKNRKPRDHGRDYLGESLYPSTRALRQLLPRWSEGRLAVALDLHCPWISGAHNEEIYLVGSRMQDVAREQIAFSRLLELRQQGTLPFLAGDFLPYGIAWNTGGNYSDGKGFSEWTAEIPGVRLSTGMEIPYANARGAEVNQDSARAFGVALGKALADYIFEA